MNARQLEKLGIPRSAAKWAVIAVQQLSKDRTLSKSDIKRRIKQVADSPALFDGDPILSDLARELQGEPEPEVGQEISYKTWGEQIDQAAHRQMRDACCLPSAKGAALMPDAHVGYGLPIGGVLALENTVVPYAVGVDIACRMKLSVIDMPTDSLHRNFENYRQSLENGTFFGIGSSQDRVMDHPVFDRDWTVTRVTRQNKDKARRQLGTSGSGNHFVEFGELNLTEDVQEFGLSAGKYVALMSHSGSRGTGASVCTTYSNIASRMLSPKYSRFGRLAWLDLNEQEGQDYWQAMNLMGHYASANHDVIHKNVTKLLGARIIAGVENHHNFAWKETHNGKELIVHRKGATPAGNGVLGVIPGSMAAPAFLVRGRGNSESLQSASHGAGRKMSRKAAKNQFRFSTIKKTLEKRGIRILSAGADEVPGAYKDIEQVMAQQADLIDPIARFDPKIVKMCGDGSRAED